MSGYSRLKSFALLKELQQENTGFLTVVECCLGWEAWCRGLHWVLVVWTRLKTFQLLICEGINDLWKHKNISKTWNDYYCLHKYNPPWRVCWICSSHKWDQCLCSSLFVFFDHNLRVYLLVYDLIIWWCTVVWLRVEDTHILPFPHLILILMEEWVAATLTKTCLHGWLEDTVRHAVSVSVVVTILWIVVLIW